MAHPSSASQNFVALARSFQRLQLSDPLVPCLAPRLIRSYATHTDLPSPKSAAPRSKPTSITSPATTSPPTADKFRSPVLTTLYSWPSMEPSTYTQFAYDHLNLPLRRDILHRAVVYEGDMTRQGTASAKHRTQVKGSSRKVRPQKGTGSARLSDRKSPSIRGGGAAHGPHPRDFSTDLPRQIYNLAFRTALSYRYKKGELIVLSQPARLDSDCGPRWFDNFFQSHGWGKGNGRSLLIANNPQEQLSEAIEQVGEHGEVQDVHDVDVKDLLSCGRLIVDQKALRYMLEQHS